MQPGALGPHHQPTFDNPKDLRFPKKFKLSLRSGWVAVRDTLLFGYVDADADTRQLLATWKSTVATMFASWLLIASADFVLGDISKLD